ncbi:MAG: hypothetical protein IPJ27_00415 [Candidatus Accumulibacter sp.]|uniref:Uncharacterized protein n=1 Tax=Candidatus Accumulibacter proximus TaxID=2954385 RepID=A0A935PW65_9PROT|nr:hypothetical protein [Candidatus Accumulibacter proximus]
MATSKGRRARCADRQASPFDRCEGSVDQTPGSLVMPCRPDGRRPGARHSVLARQIAAAEGNDRPTDDENTYNANDW